MSDFISHHLSCFIPSWHLWTFLHACVCAQFGLALCDPMGCSLPGSSVHGIFQARILERVAISVSRGSSWPRDWTCISCISCSGRQILYRCTTREACKQLCAVMSDSIWPYGLQPARLLKQRCPSVNKYTHLLSPHFLLYLIHSFSEKKAKVISA